MNKIKVYFAGSIRGGRDKAENYKKIICLCENTANLSAMISGNPKLDLILYSKVDELKKKLADMLE